MPNIAIVWDFDGTLIPDDSTTKVAKFLGAEDDFWSTIKKLRGDTGRPKWEHILASDAPIWMYSLGRMADARQIPLNSEFFKKFMLAQIKTYHNVTTFLESIKKLSDEPRFKKLGLEIHHFIVSAGLKNLVELTFPEGLITHTFGCRYEVVLGQGKNEKSLSNVPVFCMDETMKTRSLFEISKGSFNDVKHAVNNKVPDHKLWAPFINTIYIGDGDTDVPALSLTRSKGGKGIAVYNPALTQKEQNKKHKSMRTNQRADLITPADFRLTSELYHYITNQCEVVRQRYDAHSKASNAAIVRQQRKAKKPGKA